MTNDQSTTTMNILSQLRHLLTYLAGLGTAFAAWHIISPDSAAAVDQAANGLAVALTALAGAIAVGASRQAMTWLATVFTTGAGEVGVGNKSGGLPAWGLAILTGVTAAGLGFSLPSCSAANWAAFKAIPLKTCVVTDYGQACYSSKSGISVEVDAQSGK